MSTNLYYCKALLLCGALFILAACEQHEQHELAPATNQAKEGALTASGSQEAKRKSTSYTTYVIKKGQHSTSSPFKSLRTNSMVFEAVFDNSAIYTSINPDNQLDINKLYGMADCGSTHHTNSARFGWRWYNSSLQVLAYVYANGVRYSKLMTTVDLNKAYKYELLLSGNQYIFTVNGVSVSMPRACSNTGSGYQLYPYFGGDEVAPHDITIKIKDL